MINANQGIVEHDALYAHASQIGSLHCSLLVHSSLGVFSRSAVNIDGLGN